MHLFIYFILFLPFWQKFTFTSLDGKFKNHLYLQPLEACTFVLPCTASADYMIIQFDNIWILNPSPFHITGNFDLTYKVKLTLTAHTM